MCAWRHQAAGQHRLCNWLSAALNFLCNLASPVSQHNGPLVRTAAPRQSDDRPAPAAWVLSTLLDRSPRAGAVCGVLHTLSMDWQGLPAPYTHAALPHGARHTQRAVPLAAAGLHGPAASVGTHLVTVGTHARAVCGALRHPQAAANSAALAGFLQPGLSGFWAPHHLGGEICGGVYGAAARCAPLMSAAPGMPRNADLPHVNKPPGPAAMQVQRCAPPAGAARWAAPPPPPAAAGSCAAAPW